MRGASRWIVASALVCLACPASESDLTDPTDGSPEGSSSASSSSSGTGSSTGQSTATTAPSTSESTTAGTDTGSQCLDPFRCIDATPADWTGPVSVVAQIFGETPPLCTAPFPTESVTLFADPLGTPATCTCSCDGATGQVCGATLRHDFSSNCASVVTDEFDIVAGTCSEISGSGLSEYFLATPIAPTGGSCAPSLEAETSEATWDTRLTTCSPAEIDLSACGAGQQCAPPPPEGFEPTLCIYRQGDVECPADTMFAERRVYFGDFQDTRSCIDDCECGDPSGGDCSNGVVLLHSAMGCGSTVGGVPTDGTTCYDHMAAGVRSADFQGTAQGSTCAPSGGTPTGEVVGDAPVTFCCG